MSAEADFTAMLVNAPAVTALVGARIAQNAVPQDEPLPLIVFASSHTPRRGLDNTLLADEVLFVVQCWGEDGVTADQVADAVEAALLPNEVIARETGYNEELRLDCTVLTVQWWVV